MRCSICHTRIREGEDETTTCPTCQSHYHQECWVELGGCATYGCEMAPEAEKAPPPENVHVGWGDAKDCPACGQSIGSSLLICKYCGARFPWADPMTPKQYEDYKEETRRIKSTRNVIAWLFLGSLTGFLAPLTGPIAGLYAHSHREDMQGTAGAYLALAYGSAALGGVYLLIILLLLLGL